MSDTRISVLIASRNRPDQLRKCLGSVAAQDYESAEIIVLDDGSEPALKEQLAPDLGSLQVTWLRHEEPAGVSGARNTLVENASSDILVFLDDDAWFASTDALEILELIFAREKRLGILSFQIHLTELDSGQFQVPFPKKTVSGDPAILNRQQAVSYFVGAGHAINRQVFKECGPYPTEFVYGHEELDLAYRTINAGFQVIYDPSIRVVHAPASSQVPGAEKRKYESYYLTRNRIWVAYRNLPWKYAIVYSLVWSLYYLIESIRHIQLLGWIQAIKDGVFKLKSSERRPLSDQAVKYVSEHHGRLWR